MTTSPTLPLQAALAFGMILPYLLLFFAGIPIIISLIHFSRKSYLKTKKNGTKNLFQSIIFPILKSLGIGFIGLSILFLILHLIIGNDIER
jgi:hypothetical protein